MASLDQFMLAVLFLPIGDYDYYYYYTTTYYCYLLLPANLLLTTY